MSTPNPRPLFPNRTPGSSLQIVFGAILAISLLLAINFSGRIAARQQIDGKYDDLQRSIKTLQAQATALQYELGFVDSNQFVEQWARKEGRMVRGNELLIVPVPARTTPIAAPTAVINIPPTPDRSQVNNVRLWWQLFFDMPAPDWLPN